jgi:hypothetical protein
MPGFHQGTGIKVCSLRHVWVGSSVQEGDFTVNAERQAEVVGAIYLALIEAPASLEERALHLDLVTCSACAGMDPAEIAAALAGQDEDTLSAVAGRPVARLASMPTGIAI